MTKWKNVSLLLVKTLVSIVSWYVDAFKKIADFDGRACRKEYWIFKLVNFCISFFLAVILINLRSQIAGIFIDLRSQIIVVFMLLIFLLSISVTVRRLHDINLRGWWALLMFIPHIGYIIVMILCCIGGTSEANRFGDRPENVKPLFWGSVESKNIN